MAERRIDPDDGQTYTYEELCSWYKGKYKKKEIDAYWETCAPSKRDNRRKKGGGYDKKENDGKEDLTEVSRKLAPRRTLTFKHVFTPANPGKVEDHYEMVKKLGEGGFGICRLAMCKNTKQQRAIKQIDIKTIKDQKAFDKEIAIQQQLNHPNIVRLYETFKDVSQVYLVMEICSGGDLFDEIKREDWLGEPEAANCVRDMLSALHYLHHQKHIVHRDIKPENFLLQSKAENAPLKLIDFGLSKEFIPGRGSKMKTVLGTPYYIAPQVIDGSYDEKCDVWSTGAIGYFLMSGLPPFSGGGDKEVMKKVKKDPVEFPDYQWEDISDEAKDLITKLLSKDDKKRPAAGDMLNHKWITEQAEKRTGSVSPQILKSLQSFKNKSKLKRVALTVVAQRLVDDDVDELKKTFALLDADQDGVISPAEMRAGLEKHGIDIPENLDDILRSCDSDGSGALDYTEFLAATIPHQHYSRAEMVETAFRTFQKDKDKGISRKELATLLQEDPDSEMITTMLKDVDTGDSGDVGFEAFSDMMTKQSTMRRKSLSLDNFGKRPSVSPLLFSPEDQEKLASSLT